MTEGDGVSLISAAQPIPPWYESLYWRWIVFWRWQILYRFCPWTRPYETVEIEIHDLLDPATQRRREP